MRRAFVPFLSASVLICANPLPAQVPADVRLERYPDDSTVFEQPIGVRAPNDGSGRVFVIERCGRIRVVKDGVVLERPFLTVSTRCEDEQGLLGLAFHPDFARNGTFYVAHTAGPGSGPGLGELEDQWLVRYEVSSNPDVAKSKGTVVLRIPSFARHHVGGDIAFGPDGYLYWSMGDGGEDGHDPGQGLAQCTQRKRKDNNPDSCGDGPRNGRDIYYLRGKIMRLDVDNETRKAPSNLCGVALGRRARYAIPPGNPFADAQTFPDACGEIHHWGLRNPYRFSFDRETGAMLIADVGHGRYEEVSYLPPGSLGRNLQWPICEGLHTLADDQAPCAGPEGSLPPKLVTPRGAIIGGYVYRGPVASLRGRYVFGDFVQGRVYVAAEPVESRRHWRYEAMPDVKIPGVYGFGEDADANLYVASGISGEVYRFVADDEPSP